MTFLDAVSKSDLAQFLNECASVSEIDVDLALQIAISHIQSHDKRQFNAKHLKGITELHKRWKASLQRKQPDFSVYEDTYYVCELWLCWIRYSRRTFPPKTSALQRWPNAPSPAPSTPR